MKDIKADITLSELDRAIIGALGYTVKDTPDGVIIPEELAEELDAVANHGCANACPTAFVYFADTWEFFRENRELLREQLREQADEGLYGDGVTGCVSAVLAFACFRKDGKRELEEAAALALYSPLPSYAEAPADVVAVANAIVWGAVEDLAFRHDGAECEEVGA